ncbi:MAG: hypothetical protein KAS32_11455 [Candidatus Peribacteraceae bacterium]|nr:hypothetical protein [Candidatus Peribacteraceae bacterium]
MNITFNKDSGTTLNSNLKVETLDGIYLKINIRCACEQGGDAIKGAHHNMSAVSKFILDYVKHIYYWDFEDDLGNSMLNDYLNKFIIDEFVEHEDIVDQCFDSMKATSVIYGRVGDGLH